MGTDSGTCAPEIAWSNVIETCASRSLPRSERGRWRAPERPPPPKRFERMSPIEEASKSKLPKPPKPPPGPAPVANGPLPESYCLRFSGSPSTSWTCEISLKRACAHQSHALEQRVLRRGRRDRAVEVVERGQELLDDLRDAALERLLVLARDALSVVLEVRLRALREREVLIALRGQLEQLVDVDLDLDRVALAVIAVARARGAIGCAARVAPRRVAGRAAGSARLRRGVRACDLAA